MIETDSAVRREILVRVPPERAFERFTAEMTETFEGPGAWEATLRAYASAAS